MVKIGPITIAKPAPSTFIRKQIEDEGRRKGREMLRRNFDSRDYWNNFKPHCHAVAEHIEGIMVLPEFKINHRYYSTHVLFKDLEPIRRSEYIKNDEDEPNKPCKSRRAFEEVAHMTEECSLNGVKVTQADILKKAKELDSELYKYLLEGEVMIVLGSEED